MFSETCYFLRLSLRYFSRKQLSYTIVNIVGLAVGFTCVLVAGLYGYDELSYDRFHPDSKKIFRLVVNWSGDGVTRNWARSSIPVGRVGDGSIPEIDQRIRIRKNPGTDLLSVENKDFYESQMLFVESGFFDLFGFQLLSGEPTNVLEDKNNIVLTESTAKKYFGDQDPIGKTIRYDGRFDLKVTGIAKNPPSQSHIQFDCLITFALLEDIFSESRRNHWGQFDHYTYLKISSTADPEKIEAKMGSFLANQAPDWVTEKITLKLQSIRSIHLQSQRQGELSFNSDITYSAIFLIAATMILLLALINYTNLLVAICLTRSKEMAMRKILGSTRRKLLTSLITESILFMISGMVLAILMVQIIMPLLGTMTGKDLTGIQNLWGLLLCIVLSILIGAFAGIFPALQLVKLSTSSADISKRFKSSVGNILIIVQLMISSLLIMAVLGVTKQLVFMQQASLGYEDGNVLIIPIKDRSQNRQYKTIVERIKNVPGIKTASFSSSTPGTNNYLTYTYKIENTNREEAALSTIILDENFFDLYNIGLTQGRLPDGLPHEGTQVILNQAAVDFLELKEPVGKSVKGKANGTITGVVENFQINSLHSPMEPVIMYNFLPTLRYVSVKPEQAFSAQTIDQLGHLWSDIYPQYPLEFGFLEEDNLRLYSFEKGVLFSLDILVVIAVFIAAFGLIGNAALGARRSAREYSIRKVLGGSSRSILYHAFIRLVPSVLLGTIIAISFGYWGLNSWLQGFAFQSKPGLAVYLLPIILMCVLLVLFVGGILIRQLNQAPTKFLKEE